MIKKGEEMKKLSLLIAMILCVTIGGVYATWTYTQNTDVADESVNKSLNLTGVEYVGSYGTYSVNVDGLTLKIDPKPNTTHVTSLVVDGQIDIVFTPNSVAPQAVKDSAVRSTYLFTLSNPNWLYEGSPVVVLKHTDAHEIEWTKQGDGTFKYTISAEALADHITLTEFTLDTKVKYDAYNTVLGTGAIVLTVSDGITSTTTEQPQA